MCVARVKWNADCRAHKSHPTGSSLAHIWEWIFSCELIDSQHMWHKMYVTCISHVPLYWTICFLFLHSPIYPPTHTSTHPHTHTHTHTHTHCDLDMRRYRRTVLIWLVELLTEGQSLCQQRSGWGSALNFWSCWRLTRKPSDEQLSIHLDTLPRPLGKRGMNIFCVYLIHARAGGSRGPPILPGVRGPPILPGVWGAPVADIEL